MPITFDNKASGQTQGTSLKVLLTAAANTTLLAFTTNGFGISVSSMAYGGVALQRKAMVVNTDYSATLELWVLSAPGTGILTLSAQFVSSVNWGMIGVTYLGVKASNGFGTPVSATAAGGTTTINLSLSSTNTDLVVACFATGYTDNIIANNGTLRGSATASFDMRMIVADITGALAITVSATSSAASWAVLGIPLLFSAAAGGSSRFFGLRSLVGVGV